jgi:hypothetical protein
MEVNPAENGKEPQRAGVSSALSRRLETAGARQPEKAKRKGLPVHKVGSGNIFADLGLPNAEEHQLNAALTVQIKRLTAAAATDRVRARCGNYRQAAPQAR